MRYTQALLPPGALRIDPELSALAPDALARYAADTAKCGDHYQQGGGTYHCIAYGEADAAVLIGTLGPFASGGNGGSSRGPLEAAGFRWIDDTTGDVTVTGLCVYYFGGRVPLDSGRCSSTGRTEVRGPRSRRPHR